MAFFNIAIPLIYYMFLDVGSRPLRVALITLVVFGCVGVLRRNSGRAFWKFIHDLQISLLSIFLILCLLEVLAHLFPNSVPTQIRNYLSFKNIGEARGSYLEYLDENPFVKFKPHTTIRSQGFRGTDVQFAYEWKTDKRGFKNLPEVASLEEVFAVAVGDSFTEGMGVQTEETWASLLTKKGYPTYNLGVQGYAPIQLAGVLRQYGIGLNPKYVIAGYTAGTFKRENTFLDEEAAIRNKKFTGGIQSFAASEAGEIRFQARCFFSAVYLLTVNRLREAVKTSIYGMQMKRGSIFARYQGEISKVDEKLVFDETAPAWIRTLKGLSEMKDLADTLGAQLIILYFPHRGEVYYERETGKPLPEDSIEQIEASKLDTFCKKKGVTFINLTETFVKYVNQMDKEISVENYPYLELDGHLSKMGHKLTTDRLKQQLNLSEK